LDLSYIKLRAKFILLLCFLLVNFDTAQPLADVGYTFSDSVGFPRGRFLKPGLSERLPVGRPSRVRTGIVAPRTIRRVSSQAETQERQHGTSRIDPQCNHNPSERR